MAVLNEEKGHHSLIEILVAMRNLDPERLAELFGEVDKATEDCIEDAADQLLLLPLIVGEDGVKIEGASKTELTDLAGVNGCIGAIMIEANLDVQVFGSGVDYYLNNPFNFWVGVIDLANQDVPLFEEECWDPDADLKQEFKIENDPKHLLNLIETAINWVRKFR